MADNQRFGAVISALLAVATAFLGWVTLRGTLGPLRPLQDRPSAEIPLSAQDVTARLWEDPLQAVQGARASHATADVSSIPSQPYSASALASLRAQHRAVFVNAMAAWCITRHP